MCTRKFPVLLHNCRITETANIRLVSVLSTTPISRCDCPTTGNIARYPGGGVFRHYRTSPSTSNKDMCNCLMRCAYKVCLPYGCALHDPIGTKPRMIFSAPLPIGGRRITYHRGLSSLFGVAVKPLTTLLQV
jgi:hypothetical protein